MVPAAAGSGFTDIAKLAEAEPVPQALTPLTVRFPVVALVEKLAVMEAVVPEGENPAPE